MASTNKTPKLGLNQYVSTDKPTMADYNADMLKIDGFKSDFNSLFSIGTWSPTIGGETTKGTMTYDVRNANYFKLGKFVHCEFMITGLNLTGSSGPLAIQDLPFVPLSKGCVSDNLGWQTVSTNVMISFSNIGTDKGKLRLGTNGQTILTNTSLSNVIATGAFNYVCE